MNTLSETVQAAQRLQITGTLVQMGGDIVPCVRIECEDGAIVEVVDVPKALLASMPPLLYKRVTLTVEAEEERPHSQSNAVTVCACGWRAASQCPGEWRAGCELPKVENPSRPALFEVGKAEQQQPFPRAWAAALPAGLHGIAVPAGEDAEAALQQAKDPDHAAHIEGWQEAEQQADRAAQLARWANAPAEAQWLAEDPDGACYFHDGRPFQSHPSRPWYSKGWIAAGRNILGRVACEPRPEAEGER